MKPTKVGTDKIRPDPEQPRKIFDEAHIRGLSENLKIEGIINPIEVDGRGMIITGECRWRAAKLAGWKEVPIIINDKVLTEYQRLRRQMAENLHQSAAGGSSPMNAIDVANGYKRMISMKTGKDYRPGRTSRKEVYGLIKGMPEELGVNYDTIHQYLKLLDEPGYVLEDIKGGRARTLYREAGKVPEEYRERMKLAIAKGKVKSHIGVERFNRIVKLNPEKAEIAFLRMTQQQNEESNRILNRAIELSLALKVANNRKFSERDRKMIKSQLIATRKFIDRSLKSLTLLEKNHEK